MTHTLLLTGVALYVFLAWAFYVSITRGAKEDNS